MDRSRRIEAIKTQIQPTKNPALDELVWYPLQKEFNREMEELRAVLFSWSRCCRSGNFEWPTPASYRRFMDLVSALYQHTGRKRATPGWHTCQAVDRAFPAVKLCSRVTKLVERAAKFAPVHPLEKINQIAAGSGKQAGRAREVMTELERFRVGPVAPHSAEWRKFEPVLKSIENCALSQFERVAASPDLIAYAACQELSRATLQWEKENGVGAAAMVEWASTSLCRAEFIEHLTSLIVPYEKAEELSRFAKGWRDRWKRYLAWKRVRRHRAKQ